MSGYGQAIRVTLTAKAALGRRLQGQGSSSRSVPHALLSTKVIVYVSIASSADSYQVLFCVIAGMASELR